jgi:uncharacterized phage protein gp47/JayE
MAGVTPPVLWDKGFPDLYADATARIKSGAPDYTALLPSDPGIAILDALLYQTALLGERLNRLPYAALVSWINYLGLAKKGAVAAVGTVHLTLGEAAPRDLLIPQGTRFLSASGLGFASTAEVIVRTGATSADVACVSEIGGSVGNVAAHQIIYLYPLLPFVRSVDNPDPFVGGLDTELDADALDRGRKLLTHLWRAVTPTDYAEIARAVPGVAKAVAIDREGEVRLYILSEDGQPANAALIQSALTVLDPLRPQGVALMVLPAVVMPVAITARVRLVPGATLQTVQALAAGALRATLNPLAWVWGRKVSIAELDAALEEVGGVDYVEELVLPHDNIAIPPEGLATLGELTLNAV